MKNKISLVSAFAVVACAAFFAGWRLQNFAIALPIAAHEARQPQNSQAALAPQNLFEKNADYKLLTAAEVVRQFETIPKTPPTNRKIVDEKFYNVAVARVADRNGPPEHHRDSDRVFFVQDGAATMRIGGKITDPEEKSPGEFRSKSGAGYAGFREVKIEAGAILSIPRDVPYQLVVKGGDVSFIVVRIN